MLLRNLWSPLVMSWSVADWHGLFCIAFHMFVKDLHEGSSELQTTWFFSSSTLEDHCFFFWACTLHAGYSHRTDGVLWSCKPVAVQYVWHCEGLANLIYDMCLQVAHSKHYGRGCLTPWWTEEPTCVACSWWVLYRGNYAQTRAGVWDVTRWSWCVLVYL